VQLEISKKVIKTGFVKNGINKILKAKKSGVRIKNKSENTKNAELKPVICALFIIKRQKLTLRTRPKYKVEIIISALLFTLNLILSFFKK
jgi:hypothetical protein